MNASISSSSTADRLNSNPWLDFRGAQQPSPKDVVEAVQYLEDHHADHDLSLRPNRPKRVTPS